MTQKKKAKPKPLRGASLVREMFASPETSFTIDEVVAKLGHKGLTPRASASAIFSVLANPAKTKNPVKIARDKTTGKYALVPGWHPAPRDLPDKPAAPKAKAKAKGKPKGKTTGANGPVVAAAA